ncbi:MAG: choice-of-anchor Q domain-containing protein, partial [Ilumatobacteraceae bacterium]
MSSSATHRPRPTVSRLARLLAAGALVSAFGLVATHHSAQATGFAVTTTADGGAGSLRDAISQANANPGPDTITVPAGTYTLTIAGANEDDNATGDFDIDDALTITGAGAGTTIIDAAGLDRVFDLQFGPIVLAGMTITNGDVGAGAGGNIADRSYVDLTLQDSIVSHGHALQGAGIVSENGVLTVLRSEITDNVATSIIGNGSLGAAISKGGLGNANLIIADSLIADNNAVGGTGALYIGSNATVTNTTITGNSAYARTVAVEGQGAYSMSVSFVHVTIAGNTETGNPIGLGLYVNVLAPASMAVTLEGSLLQDNVVQGNPANCEVVNLGAIVSEGHNVTDDASCFLTQPTDQTNDSGTTLAPLADNGGPTRTLALVAGSSAIAQNNATTRACSRAPGIFSCHAFQRPW